MQQFFLFAVQRKHSPNVNYYFNSILIILFLLFCNISFAGETGKISGKVFDSKTGEALIGAQSYETFVEAIERKLNE